MDKFQWFIKTFRVTNWFNTARRTDAYLKGLSDSDHLPALKRNDFVFIFDTRKLAYIQGSAHMGTQQMAGFCSCELRKDCSCEARELYLNPARIDFENFDTAEYHPPEGDWWAKLKILRAGTRRLDEMVDEKVRRNGIFTPDDFKEYGVSLYHFGRIQPDNFTSYRSSFLSTPSLLFIPHPIQLSRFERQLSSFVPEPQPIIKFLRNYFEVLQNRGKIK